MSYIQKKTLSTNINIPIRFIEEKNKHNYVYDILKSYEKKCFQEWGYIHSILKIKKIHSSKIKNLNFSSEIKYTVDFYAVVYEIKKDLEMQVYILDIKDIYVCHIKDTPFLILLDNPTKYLEIGDEINVIVRDFKINQKTNKMHIIASKI